MVSGLWESLINSAHKCFLILSCRIFFLGVLSVFLVLSPSPFWDVFCLFFFVSCQHFSVADKCLLSWGSTSYLAFCLLFLIGFWSSHCSCKLVSMYFSTLCSGSLNFYFNHCNKWSISFVLFGNICTFCFTELRPWKHHTHSPFCNLGFRSFCGAIWGCLTPLLLPLLSIMPPQQVIVLLLIS